MKKDHKIYDFTLDKTPTKIQNNLNHHLTSHFRPLTSSPLALPVSGVVTGKTKQPQLNTLPSASPSMKLQKFTKFPPNEKVGR